VLAIALAGAGCAGETRPSLPPGAHVVADGPALRGLLARLEGLEGTPLGRQARTLGERTAGCATVVGSAADGDPRALADALACGGRVAPALARVRGDAELLAILPLGAERRLVVRGGRTGSGLVLEARLDPPDLPARAALLAPAPGPVGPAVLDAEGALVHARVRPRDGLDLAKLVPEGSQGDRLFRLRSALFSSAVLGGVWEIAAYMPRAGEPLPPLAVALDVRRRDAAIEAAERFLSDLGEAWPVHRTPARFGSPPVPGACLLDLNILPGFAPCYAATERALVVGWNPASVERALPSSAPAVDGPSRLTVRLDRLDEADRRLRATRGLAPDAGVHRTWGWQRLRVAAAAGGEGTGRRGDGAAWRVELLAAERGR